MNRSLLSRRLGRSDLSLSTMIPAPATKYKNQGLELLKYSFPRFSVKAIGIVFRNADFDFRASFESLAAVRDRFLGLNDNEVINDETLHLEKLAPALVGVTDIIIKRDRQTKRRPRPTDPNLLAAIDNIPELNQKENRDPNLVVDLTYDDDDDALIKETFEYECGCCFGEYPFDDMCACRNGHMFCKDCLRGHIEEEVFGKNELECKCMSMDGCDAIFAEPMIKKAIPEERLDQLNETVYRLNINKVEMPDGL